MSALLAFLSGIYPYVTRHGIEISDETNPEKAELVWESGKPELESGVRFFVAPHPDGPDRGGLVVWATSPTEEAIFDYATNEWILQ